MTPRRRGFASSIKRTAAYLRGYPLHRKHKGYVYLVYSMGKVGSSTVYHTLREHLPFNAVFHVHFLSDHWLENVLPHANRPHEIKRGFAIRNYLEEHPEQRLRVVTLVREPVSRDISDIFEVPSDVVGDKNVATMPIGEIIKDFEFKKTQENFTDYTLSWFDTELAEFLDVDVYAQPFPKRQGYDVLRFADCDVLLIRLEDLNSCYRQAFAEFAGLNLGGLSVANVTDGKPLREKIEQFKKYYRVSREELEELYGSKYMTHFYSNAEISQYTAKWAADDKA